MAACEDERPWLVMKFGGTSLGTADRLKRVAEIVRCALGLKARAHDAYCSSFLDRYRVVVVLSAISPNKKAAGTTSRLLAAVKDVLTAGSKKYTQIVDGLMLPLNAHSPPKTYRMITSVQQKKP